MPHLMPGALTMKQTDVDGRLPEDAKTRAKWHTIVQAELMWLQRKRKQPSMRTTAKPAELQHAHIAGFFECRLLQAVSAQGASHTSLLLFTDGSRC